jgi:hypothetical protein
MEDAASIEQRSGMEDAASVEQRDGRLDSGSAPTYLFCIRLTSKGGVVDNAALGGISSTDVKDLHSS